MFISKDQWIEDTGGNSVLSPRSQKLVELDEAIEAANLLRNPEAEPDAKSSDGHRSKLTALGRSLYTDAVNCVSKALEAWMQEQFDKHKEQGWRDSRRNKTGAIDRLVGEIGHYRQIIGHESQSEIQALRALEAGRNESIPTLFKGCKCVSASSKHEYLSDAINLASVGASGAALVANLRKIAYRKAPEAPPRHELPSPDAPGSASESLEVVEKTNRAIDKLIRESFGVSLNSLRWEEGEEFVSELVSSAVKGIRAELASAAPLLGALPAATGLAWAVVQLLTARSGIHAVAQLDKRLTAGDSKSALQAVHAWQLQDQQLLRVRAVKSSVNLGMQIFTAASCGAAAPVGAAVGIGNAIVALADVLVEVGRQYRESRALTAYLNPADGGHPIGPEIFSTAPLAGAYYLLNTPASHIALQFVDLGSPGWRREAEALVRYGDLGKVRLEAARLIDTSRYRIVRPGGWPFIETADKTLMKKLDERYFGYHPDYQVKMPSGLAAKDAGLGAGASVAAGLD